MRGHPLNAETQYGDLIGWEHTPQLRGLRSRGANHQAAGCCRRSTRSRKSSPAPRRLPTTAGSVSGRGTGGPRLERLRARRRLHSRRAGGDAPRRTPRYGDTGALPDSRAHRAPSAPAESHRASCSEHRSARATAFVSEPMYPDPMYSEPDAVVAGRPGLVRRERARHLLDVCRRFTRCAACARRSSRTGSHRVRPRTPHRPRPAVRPTFRRDPSSATA